MAISRVTSGNNGSFNSGYQVGDLIVILSFDSTSATVPSTPTGYTSLTSAQQSASTCAMAVFYKFALSTSETYPTITNGTASTYAIYRGVNPSTPFTQTSGQSSSGSSTTISYSGIVTYANPKADWVLTFGTANLSTAGVGSVPPTSMTLVNNGETTGSLYDIAIFDSNAPLSTYSFNSKTLSNSAVTMTKTTELIASTATFMEAGTDSTYDTSLWNLNTSGTGTLTSDSTQSQDGLRSLKCHVGTAGDVASVYTANSIVSDAGARISSWFRFSTNTPSVLTQFMSPETSSNGSLIFGLGMNTNGTLLLGARGTTQMSGSTVLSANTWYRISMAYVLTSTSNYTCNVYINGTLEVSLTQANGNAGLTGSSCCTFGQNTSSQNGFTSTSAMDIWVDSVYIDNSNSLTDPGNVHVTAKRPFSNGTSIQFTTQIGSGGSGYGSGHTPQVNERPESDTNGWSLSTTTKATEEYNIENAATGDVSLTGATLVDYMGWVRAKESTTSNSPVSHIIVNGVATTITLTTSAAYYLKAAGNTTYPAGSGTDIGMDGQYTTTAGLYSLYEAGMMFAYVPANAAPVGKNIAPLNNTFGELISQAVNRASFY